ncbi:EamA family transporter [Chishuiella sp.]|uniref:EamA family transporter n=1 Tax=Chishuiella sp. TaxID=1969467 RepID=UPI0028AE44D2|nr:EamA family transporter [Chishuiella sp.]
MWWIYALLSAVFASLTAITAKIGVNNVNSNLATGIRTIIVLLMIWFIIFARNEHKEITFITKQNIIFLIVSGICTGLSWIFYFRALKIGNVSQVALIDKFSIVLTIILATFFLKEKIDIKTILGATFIVGGTLILLLK